MPSMLDAIQQVLESHPEVHDWTAQATHQDSTQLYLIGAEPEAHRRTHTARYDLTIFRDHDGARGEANISLQPGDIARLPARLDEAVYLAGMSHNPPFSLPPPAGPYPEVA
ncbi:MAG TPA: hypothetical protein VKY74_13855, partial [Chloroflexia bacterium]|nr:hypothetical protein [Chloroflexia bacterium]